MSIRYPAVLSVESPVQTWSFGHSEAILYALCLGFGGDPMGARELPFVLERNFKVVPTLPTVLAWIARPTFEELGVDAITALHGEQKIELHGELSVPVTLRVQGRVLEVYDKGVGRGATVLTQHRMTDAADGRLVATLTTTCFARAEGGCGGSVSPAPVPHAVPQRLPDHSLDVPTRADLALLYRLTGDLNPIHADPEIALRAGFQRPILHGLCSFGITCRAVLQTVAAYDCGSIASHQARFAAPVYPGETLTVDLWRDGEVVSFEARIKQRGVTAIKNGCCVLRRRESPGGN